MTNKETTPLNYIHKDDIELFIRDNIEIFRSIADYYKINVITLYLKANFITQNDLNGYKSIFKNCDELTEEEIKHIQNEIDFINSQKNKYR